MTPLRRLGVILLCVFAALLVLAVGLWLARARLVAEVARTYFRSHGIESSIEIGRLGYSGLSGRFALGPKDAPDVSVERMEVQFDPLSWTPRIVAVRLVNPVVRARVGAGGKVTLPNLQSWIESLSRGDQTKSPYVSDDLAVSLSNLRALVATPDGPLDLSGDARLVKNQLVSASLAARPGTVTHAGVTARIAAASVSVNSFEGAWNIRAQFQGALRTAALDAPQVVARLVAESVRWDATRQSLVAPSLRLDLTGDFKSAMAQALGVAGRITADSVSLDVHTRNFASRSTRLDFAARRLNADWTVATNPKFAGLVEYLRLTLQPDGALRGNANMRVQADAEFNSGKIFSFFPVLTRDRRLAASIRANLSHLTLDLDGALRMGPGGSSFSAEPGTSIRGGSGAVLEAKILSLDPFAPLRLFTADLTLQGGGLPYLSWQGNLKARGNGFAGDMAVRARGDYDMLRGGDLAAAGKLVSQNGRITFRPDNCARMTLAAFHPGDSDLARDISGLICPAADKPLLTSDASGWVFTASARNAAMFLPLATARADHGAANIAFSGEGGDFGGRVAVSAARLTDNAPVIRFNPLSGTGDINLASGIWRGRFAASDGDGTALGTATFSHAMAEGTGEAKIAAPRLQFAPDKLQPAMLSPLLGPVKQAQGTARFTGTVTWTRQGIDSNGTLAIDKLDFLTPLGRAHAVEANIALASLLPPRTAPGQHIAISRIEWTLPFTGVSLDLSFSPDALKIEAAKTGIAEGTASLDALTVNLAGPRQINGAAKLDGIALAPLITATNLGNKIKLEGKVTGTVPFAVGPEGFRITNGRLVSDGPGRISLNRSVWGEAGLTANSVQDLAYQALEYLAFDSLSAELNSVGAGRLQIIFHIKGRSDPPKPQQAEIQVGDILDGTVMQKPIALPSGTPIDLTLDTSLNFDELLKSYAEAWSKSLGTP
jgi:hypothetical protein